MRKVLILLLTICLITGTVKITHIVAEDDSANVKVKTPEIETETTVAITDPKVGFQKQVLVQINECNVVTKSFNTDGTSGAILTVHLENTSNKNLRFAIYDASVNGFIVDPCWSGTLKRGKVLNSDIEWEKSALNIYGIEKIKTIQFTIRITDADNWRADKLYEDVVTLKIHS